MGGLGPGIGGIEYLIIAIVALVVVGPERLPLMLRKLGQWVARARRMADEFRSSFDEMARQSELDELRKEVEALRRGQSNMMPLGPEAEATFRGIRDDLNRPLDAPAPAAAPALAAPDEWPDSPPVTVPLETPAETEPAATPARKRKAAAAPVGAEPAKKKTPRKPAVANAAKASAAPTIKRRSGKTETFPARKVDL